MIWYCEKNLTEKCHTHIYIKSKFIIDVLRKLVRTGLVYKDNFSAQT